MLNENNGSGRFLPAPVRSAGRVAGAAGAGGLGGVRRQRGVVLMIALIMLVAMTLAGLALMRSVDTTSLIAGNLAFQQGATGYSELGATQASSWLISQSNSAPATLTSVDPLHGYSPTFSNPVSQSWDNYWINTLVPGGGASPPVTDPVTGNTVSYAIQRMCTSAGVCTTSPIYAVNPCNTSGCIAFTRTSSVYYRITVRVAGPRNTVSYAQTMLAI